MKAILGVKKEMTQIFSEDGKVLPCTIVDISDNIVVGYKTKESDGYTAMILGKGKKVKNINKPDVNKYKDLPFVPKTVSEVRSDEVSAEKGTILDTDVFSIGDKVTIMGTSKGKGFQGVMKLHGMRGGPKTHGQSTKPRSVGSIGPGQTYAHVMKGRNMARKMGNDQITIKNLKIVSVDKENNLLMIKGAVPGTRGSKLVIYQN